MPKYSKSDPAYKAGYRAAKKDVKDKATDVGRRAVMSIEQDLSKMSGLPVMLWQDRIQRQELMDKWKKFVQFEMENL